MSYYFPTRATYFSQDACEDAVAALIKTGYLKVHGRRRDATNIYILNHKRLRQEALDGYDEQQKSKELALETNRLERQNVQEFED